ncbi:MAG TPA: DEAD/DEAH box helicase [Microvirga sp.]|jgi:transcription-repair coupling factor (superfamily II helicase)|nr:DEAD/DEAH box helicase [Microvirga sp.]
MGAAEAGLRKGGRPKTAKAEGGSDVVRISGRAGEAAVALLDARRRAGGSPLVFVAAGERRAGDLVRALRGLAPELDLLPFPAWDCLPYDRASPSADLMGQRLATLAALIDRPDRSATIVTTPSALIQRVPPADRLGEARLPLTTGQRFDPDETLAVLSRLGYRQDERVDEAGEAALRGQVLDIHPAAGGEPVRVEHDGERVTALRTFDPVSQRTLADIEAVTLLAASECFVEAERVPGMEHRLPEFYGRLDTLLGLLPGATVMLDAGADERLHRAWAQIRDGYGSRTQVRPERDGGPRALPPSSLYLDEAEWAEALAGRQLIALETVDDPAFEPPPSFARHTRPGRALQDFLDREQAAGHLIVFAAPDEKGLRTLTRAVERQTGQAVAALKDWAGAEALPPGSLGALVADLDGGFRAGEIVAVTAAEVLGRRARSAGTSGARPQELAGTEIELRVGDVVVHREHGFGLLKGVETVEAAEAVTDLLRLEYAGEATLMVPVDELDRVWRYGSSEDAVSLDKIDGDAWLRRRAEMEAEIGASAERLVAAVREREAASAEKLVPPRAAFERFADRFPYPETPDQLAAIDDTLRDLASGRPMNRLVCGDVGFGKTEVALRAAAAAALADKQVAVVAPTTVLVRQHVETFRRRFDGLGIEVAHLSRLTKPADARAVKAGLADGRVRVVVGTHALTAKGVSFQDLGLVIVDEEQRFGAAQKTKLQSLGSSVHRLTLTATPIPRTLQSALVGLQDLSIIATPPARRQPIRTFLIPFDETIAREALLRERSRGGQSFLVCPRIEDIEPMAQTLGRLVPELDTVVAHGQMPVEEIDDAMVRFADGRGDVLLATNIIESGLDVPRANTMLIWRADRFGLSQLHQLRGRVGRGRVRGIAYLLTDPDQTVAKATVKRLQTLESLDRLGAGFAISARDLDQRGAGDLFGDEQAGHVKLVGIGLFQEMMRKALAAARGEPAGEDWQPEIRLGASGFIPADYVPEPEMRINLYAKFARLGSEEEVDALADEIADRFGSPPAPVERLLAIAGLQQRARAFRVARIDAGPQAVALTFREEVKDDLPARAVDASKGALAWRNGRLVWARSSETEKERLALVSKMFRFLDQVA